MFFVRILVVLLHPHCCNKSPSAWGCMHTTNYLCLSKHFFALCSLPRELLLKSCVSDSSCCMRNHSYTSLFNKGKPSLRVQKCDIINPLAPRKALILPTQNWHTNPYRQLWLVFLLTKQVQTSFDQIIFHWFSYCPFLLGMNSLDVWHSLVT